MQAGTSFGQRSLGTPGLVSVAKHPWRSYFLGTSAAAAASCVVVGEATILCTCLATPDFQAGALSLMVPVFALAVPGSIVLGFVGAVMLLAGPLALVRGRKWPERILAGVFAGAFFDVIGLLDFLFRKGNMEPDLLTGITGSWPASMGADYWAHGHPVAAVVQLLAPLLAGAAAGNAYHRAQSRLLGRVI